MFVMKWRSEKLLLRAKSLIAVVLSCSAWSMILIVLSGSKSVPEDHPLYPFCCQVRASFWSRAKGGKEFDWPSLLVGKKRSIKGSIHSYSFGGYS